jgi:hypothetical protein
VALAFLLALTGCASKPTGPKSGFYVVSATSAEFFKYGPAQSFGPDFVLKKGDRVTMLDRTWGFSRVMTENGVAGFVASEDLEPAPPSATPRIAAVSRGVGLPIGGQRGMSSSRQNRVRAEVMGDPGDPLFNVNDVPLPVLDEPPPTKGRPQFRATQPTPQESGEKSKPKFR